MAEQTITTGDRRQKERPPLGGIQDPRRYHRLLAVIGGGIYWYVSSKTVYIDQSVIQAPVINLSPTTSGPLQAVFVNVGDIVTANQPIARVGDEIVESKTSGEIVSVDKNIGEFENALSGQAVVATMVDPDPAPRRGPLGREQGAWRAWQVGDVAKFTVDTFGSKVYYGVVDEVGQTSQVSVTSNIFNQRPVNEFNVYVRFDPAQVSRAQRRHVRPHLGLCAVVFVIVIFSLSYYPYG